MRSGGGDKEAFFHCLDRVPSGIHIDGDFPSDDEDDVRVSFASAVGDLDARQSFRRAVLDEEMEDASEYDMWMSDEPMSIQERRRRLHQGLGMVSSRDLALRRHSTVKRFVDVPRTVSRRTPPSATPNATAPDLVAPSGRNALLRPRPAAAKAITRRRSDSFLVARPSTPMLTMSLRRAGSLPSPHDPCCSSLADKFQAVPTRDMSAVAVPLPAAPPTATKKQGNGSKEDAVVVAAPKDHNTTGPIVKHRGQSQRHSQPTTTAPPPKGDKSGGGKKKGVGWLKNIKSVAIGFIQDKDSTVKSAAPTATSPAPNSGSASATPAPSSSSSAASTEKLKVHNYGKSSKELTGLYMSQEIHAHDGSIWSIKFSADGRRLASGGEDSVVRVWEVVETNAPPGSVPQGIKSSGKDTLPEHLVVPDKVFALAEQPVCVLEGHEDDVLDLTWSKSDQLLLSSSMDKTVRLWDTASNACLKVFSHSDYVTCIQFNPVDDRYFISGSLDAKIRLWSIPDRQVVDWTDLNEMVTAASYTPDGQGAIVGSHNGSCRFYKTADCKLNAEAQIDIQTKKRKSQAKKITGFQFAPGSPSEVLVTSADSQIRVFDSVTMVQKFRGFKNTSSQISAAYTTDRRYVVCASEDSHVYLWRTTRSSPAAMGIGGMKSAKTWCTTRSYENFYCKDVSAAVPWPNSPSSLPAAAGDGSGSPHSGKPAAQGVVCNDEVCTMASHAGGGSKPDQSGKSGELGSPSTRPLTHSGPLDPPSRKGGAGADSGNAWGLVVVTATLSGEIKVYQNFGMPFRIKGQGNPFY